MCLPSLWQVDLIVMTFMEGFIMYIKPSIVTYDIAVMRDIMFDAFSGLCGCSGSRPNVTGNSCGACIGSNGSRSNCRCGGTFTN